MGDLSDAVQWWDASQLRFLVLASLGIQYLLTVFAVGRKFSVPSWFKFGIWLLYLGSDALAIYALATLFNRQKKPNVSRDLEVLWAPFMLMHLGGQVFITAYNIEDNELWKRHVVTSLSQASFWPIFSNYVLRASTFQLLACFFSHLQFFSRN
jgi:hypothetical protein